jgi:hypothetical protein
MLTCAGLVAAAAAASADPTTATQPDAPARRQPPAVPPGDLPMSSDLDGAYVWLGPSGAASHIDGTWDSTIGADLSLVRIREREPLGALGVSLGASRWTARGGGRVWLDGLAGTRLGRMIGVSAGGILELSDLAHPKLGASIGVWAFAGVTPYARIGAVEDLGMFAEIGLHIALPVFRR